MQARSIRLMVFKTTLVITLITVAFSCKKEDNPEKDPYNLDVVLSSTDKNIGSSGFIKFRQDPDTARIIELDTRVTRLDPNRSYLLQRAVNPVTDANCTSTTWLTLGKGLQAQAIHTNPGGNGSENLWRNVTSIARGTSFRIHFQVVDSISLVPVLTSECYTYTVR